MLSLLICSVLSLIDSSSPCLVLMFLSVAYVSPKCFRRLFKKQPIRKQRRSGRVVPPAHTSPLDPKHDLNWAGWGFKDTAFRFDSTETPIISGDRYVISGKPLTGFLAFLRKHMSMSVSSEDLLPEHDKTLEERASPSRLSNSDDLLDAGIEWSILSEERVYRSHGHTHEEVYELLHSDTLECCDAVVWPRDTRELEIMFKLAQKHAWKLLPVGGCTNVSRSIRMSPRDSRQVLVCVDMTRYMCNVLWIDYTNMVACVQAGIRGRDLDKILEDHGVVMGHEPDSNEFSTLGGWIATRASGMKKNRYGNIEDIVQSATWCTSLGVVSREQTQPRVSVRRDPIHSIMGSEGRVGIISSAIIRLHIKPEKVSYDSYLFPDFQTGVRFLKSVQETERAPASVRLMDNAQFHFGRACKPESDKGWVSKKIEELYVTWWRGLDPQKMVLCTIVYEGLRTNVSEEMRSVKACASAHSGTNAGGGHGETGYQMTYAIAYIRDFGMKLGIVGESFETSIGWDNCNEMIEAVRDVVYREHGVRNLCGSPFFTARISQIYESGVCVYFYYAINGSGQDRPDVVYTEIEALCREEILARGGSLSHHHGVGTIRSKFLTHGISDETFAFEQKLLDASADPVLFQHQC